MENINTLLYVLLSLTSKYDFIKLTKIFIYYNYVILYEQTPKELHFYV